MWKMKLRSLIIMCCTLLVVAAATGTVRANEEVPSESQCRPYIEKALKELETGDSEPGSGNPLPPTDWGFEKDEEGHLRPVTNRNKPAPDRLLEMVSCNGTQGCETINCSCRGQKMICSNICGHCSGHGCSNTLREDEENDYDPGGDLKPIPCTGSDKNSDGSAGNFDRREGSIANDGEEKITVENDALSVEVNDDTYEEQKYIQDVKRATEYDSKEDAIIEENYDVYADDDKQKDDSEQDVDNYDGDSQDDQNSKKSDSREKSSAYVTAKQDIDEEGDDTTAENEKDHETSSMEDNHDSREKDKTAKNGGKGKEAEADSVGDDDDKSEKDAEDSEEQRLHTDDSDYRQKEDGSQVKPKSREVEDNDSEEPKDEDLFKTETVGESVESKGSSEKSKKCRASAGDTAEENSVKGKDNDCEGKSEEEAHGAFADDRSQKEVGAPEEELLLTGEIPKNLRYREHINQILRLDEKANEAHSAEIILNDLKKLYENSIKPLEALYKYRDLSNRHFGDAEIFSKPLVLFMGPWSGGKSSIVNYLTGLEFTEWSLRTGAEPSPAYFNILMHGKEPEVLDGTQLAADWTFSGLQKFGQGLEERLRGLKHPSKILEKVNIVEIPGILEVRKQVSRMFPFNDACQWFIDRADIIFLVYDPSKLDVGPETEAILDQLKGRESQTRIVLNKADTVKPEELMRVQSALIWNISPLMSSAQPPVMFTVSLWSMPYEAGAPVRLLQAQERELLKDLRTAVDKRIENKIANARRFAVRVRNHAKMVDCYLTTYYNHKTIFGNKKLIADAIVENPQNYHIYEGLSTLTNISRYDLPDPETYRDFFRLNPLYEFQQLSATCTYFRGCPITRLDIAISYELPELVGKYKKMVETATPQGMPKS